MDKKRQNQQGTATGGSRAPTETEKRETLNQEEGEHDENHHSRTRSVGKKSKC